MIIFTLTAIYISLDSDVRIRVDNDKSTFYINESNRWLISGVEYNKLFFGTKLVWRHAKDIQLYNYTEDNLFIVKRITPFYLGSTIIDTYTFYTNTTYIELFPISHEIELFNATGLIYQYEVKRLEYSGETVKGVLSPQSFGKNMKVEWNRIPYYSKIYKYKWKDEGKLTLKYRIESDYEKFEIRLFDPPLIEFVPPTETNGTTISVNNTVVNVTVTDPNGTAFIDWNYSVLTWLRFDNSTDFLDHSTYTNNGTNNGSTYTASGKYGGARDFDGIDDSIDCGNDSSLNFGSGEFSIELWVKTSAIQTGSKILMKKPDETSFFYLAVGTASIVGFTIEDGIQASDTFGTTLINDSIWHHIVAQRNNTNTNLYIDGVLEDTDDATVVGSIDSTNNVYIGGTLEPPYDTFFNGTIDEVRIHNRSLSTEEINASYNNSAYNLYHNFTDLDEATYEYKAYVQDSDGNTNSTELRTLIITGPSSSITNLYLNELSQDRFYELGHIVQLKANVTSSGSIINETVCLDIDSINYGDDFICSNGTVEYNWTTEIAIDKFNDSTTEKNLSYSAIENQTVYFKSHSLYSIDHLTINLTGVDDGGYPGYYKIHVNDTLTNTFTGTLEPGIKTQDEFTNEKSYNNLSFPNTTSQTIYFDVNKNAKILNATLNISGYGFDAEGIYDSQWSTYGHGTYNFGIAAYDIYVWTIDRYQETVYKYYDNGTYITEWSTSGHGITNEGITTDGSNIWIVDPGYDKVYKYNMTGNYITEWSTSGHGGANHDLTTDGSNIWTIDFYTDKVYKYDMDGNYVSNWSVDGHGYTNTGITTDGNNIWTTDYYTNLIYKYNMTGVYIKEWDTAPYTVHNYGLASTINGSFILVVDTSNDKIYNYYTDKEVYTNNTYIDIEADGSIEWQDSGILNESNSPKNIGQFGTNITHYLVECTADANGDCQIPVRIGTSNIGNVNISALNATYNLEFNPITITTSILNDYINSFTNQYINIPINIESNQGNITVDGVNYSYDGDYNATITAHFDGNVNYSASRDSHVTKLIWSNFDIAMPSLIDYIDFFPLTSNSRNVTPFGQTSSIPIINLSSLSTSSANYAIRFDTQPNSCINDTLSNTSSKNDGSLLTETLTTYLTLTPLQSNGLWLWRDYFSCTAGGTYSDVIYNISACCSDCVSCW